MRRTISARSTLLTSLATAALALFAVGAQSSEIVRLDLPPWEDGVVVWSQAPDMAETRSPVHGTLARDEQGDLWYRPSSSSFWDVGSDAFLLETTNAGGGTESTRFVVHAGVQALLWARFGFEPSEPEPERIGEPEQLGPDVSAALHGTRGARVELDGSGWDAHYRIPVPSSPPERGAPNTTDAGCADMRMDLSSGGPGGDPGSIREALEACLAIQDSVTACTFTLLRVGGGDTSDIARVQVAMNESETWIRGVFIDDSAQQHVTAWVTLEDRPYTLRTDWWTAARGGIRLWLDGRVVASTVGHASTQESRTVDIGVIDAPIGARLSFSFDSIYLYDGMSERATTMPMNDPFETDLSQWAATGAGGGSLRLDPSAALAGDAGLEIGLGAGWGSWLRDGSPMASDAAGLRFLVDASSLYLGPKPSTPTGGPVLGLVHALESDIQNSGTAFNLRLWGSSTGFRIQASATHDDGGIDRTRYEPAGDVHVVELRWQAAVEPGSRDGWLRFWLDGQLVGEVMDLDNAQTVTDSIRLGTLGQPTEASGRLLLDEYEVLRVDPAAP